MVWILVDVGEQGDAEAGCLKEDGVELGHLHQMAEPAAGHAHPNSAEVVVDGIVYLEDGLQATRQVRPHVFHPFPVTTRVRESAPPVLKDVRFERCGKSLEFILNRSHEFVYLEVICGLVDGSRGSVELADRHVVW